MKQLCKYIKKWNNIYKDLLFDAAKRLYTDSHNLAWPALTYYLPQKAFDL